MKTCASILLVLALAAIASAGEPADRDPVDEAAQAEARFESIRAEIRALPGHAWAGDYYSGDGLGANMSLAIAPKAGYQFEWRGCLGVYQRLHGTVDVVDAQLRLGSIAQKGKTFRGIGIAYQLVPVSWGQRQYLIPADGVVAFCNSVNRGLEPRTSLHGLYFLRRGDEEKQATGFPEVPEKFRPYLLAKPVQATITAIINSSDDYGVPRSRETTVAIDAGTIQGLLVGMELRVINPDVSGWFQITTVEPNRAEATLRQPSDSPTIPRMGWRLSTRRE